jgi:hypothetical protein
MGAARAVPPEYTISTLPLGCEIGRARPDLLVWQTPRSERPRRKQQLINMTSQDNHGNSQDSAKSSRLQDVAERFMAAGVGTSRAGFDFKPEGEGRNEAGGVPIPQAGSPQRSASPQARSPSQDIWRSTFHPGGRSPPGGNLFDSAKDHVEGAASGQSVSEIYAQKRNQYYIPPRKD